MVWGTIALGAAQAGLGFFKANNAQAERHNAYRQQRQETNLANRRAMSSFYSGLDQQKAGWQNIVNVAGQEFAQAKQNAAFIDKAANRAYGREQLALNETFAEAAFSSEDRFVAQAMQSGQAAAAGMTGASAGNIARARSASFGRAEARQADYLTRSRLSRVQRMEDFQESAQADRARAFARSSIAPMLENALVAPHLARAPMAPGQGMRNMDLMMTGLGAVGSIGGGIADASKSGKFLGMGSKFWGGLGGLG
jgi:hypothetical protein